MSILPLTIPAKRLIASLSTTGMTFKLNNIRGWGGDDLVPADFGTEAYAVLINSTRTQIEIIKFDPATIANENVTILTRGLGYTGGDIEVPANKFAWPSNDTVVQMGTDAPQLFRDFMSASNTVTITAQHEYDVLPESAIVPTDDEDFVNKAYVDAKTGSALAVPVNQVAHGFVFGDVIRASGTNTYTKAQADSAINAEVVGIVNTVAGVDDFTYTTEGAVTAGVPVEVAGTVLFLSPATAGALTATEPVTIGHVSLPLAIITESGVSMVFHKFRGAVLSTIAGNPIASETTAGIVEQATPAEVAAGTDVGGSGAPLFVVPSLIPAGQDVKEFASSGTWNKPQGLKFIKVICIGAGGGGASGASTTSTSSNRMGGGAGGGGAVYEKLIFESELGTNETITVGTGGTGAASVTGSTSPNPGGNGIGTSFGTHLFAGGGGGGAGGGNGSSTGGGSGGGGATTNGVTATGGVPAVATGGIDIQAVSGITAASTGHNAVRGGAAGGNGANGTGGLLGSHGGGSLYGGAGGGGGGGSNGVIGYEGGKNGIYAIGGGAAGGVSSVGNTTGANGGYLGGGGGGAGGQVGVLGGRGGNGGIGGGGGGGGATSMTGNASGAGGDGGNGAVIVIEYYA